MIHLTNEYHDNKNFKYTNENGLGKFENVEIKLIDKNKCRMFSILPIAMGLKICHNYYKKNQHLLQKEKYDRGYKYVSWSVLKDTFRMMPKMRQILGLGLCGYTTYKLWK